MIMSIGLSRVARTVWFESRNQASGQIRKADSFSHDEFTGSKEPLASF